MFSYQPEIIPLRIIVVGAGGTGSRLAPTLTQFVSSVGWLNQIGKARVLFIDGDEVEEKNCVRQNFIRGDIGKKKAEVISARYGRAYDVITGSLVRFVSSDNVAREQMYDQIREFFGDNWEKTNYLLIMCVDSVKARMEVLKTLGSNAGLIIDSGNEDDFGQVSVFQMKSCDSSVRMSAYSELFASVSGLPESIPLNYLPFDPSLYEGRVETEKSCADLDQTLAINNMVAAGIMSVVQTVTFRSHPLTYQTIRFNLNGSNSTDYYSARRMSQILNPENIPRSGKVSIEGVDLSSAIKWQDDIFSTEALLSMYDMSKRGFLKWEGAIDNIYRPIIMDKALEVREARRADLAAREEAARIAQEEAEQARVQMDAQTIEATPIEEATPAETLWAGTTTPDYESDPDLEEDRTL